MSLERGLVLERAVMRTRAILDAFGVSRAPDSTPDEGALSTILLCRGGRLGKLAGAAGPDVDILCALSTTVALEFLVGGTFDVLVVDAPSLAVEARLAVEEVRRNPALGDVPVIVVAPPFDAPFYEEAGATAVSTVDGLREAIRAYGASFRRVRAWKRELRALKAVRIGDTASGLSGRAPFAAHLDRVITTKETPVTLGVIRVRMPGAGTDVDLPPPPAILRSIGTLLGSITRAEDMIAEIRAATFGIIFPGAEPKVAERVVARLSAVVGSSAVLAADGTPVQPDVDHAVLPISGFGSVEDLWQAIRARIGEAERRRLGV